MYSYLISHYSDALFGQNKIQSNQELLNAANKIIYYLETLNIKYYNNVNFLKAVNQYYSLYKFWILRDKLQDLELLYDQFVSYCKLISIMDYIHTLSGKRAQ